MGTSKLRILKVFIAFPGIFSPSAENANSADRFASIVLIAAFWLDAKDEVQPQPTALSAGPVEDLLVRFQCAKMATDFEYKIRTGCSFLKSTTPLTGRCAFSWCSPLVSRDALTIIRSTTSTIH